MLRASRDMWERAIRAEVEDLEDPLLAQLVEASQEDDPHFFVCAPGVAAESPLACTIHDGCCLF